MANLGMGSTDGRLFIFTGTGGSGRKTLARKACQELGIMHVLSCTTREPRPYEVSGREYHFLTRQTFIDMDIRGEFIQVVEVDGHLYGIRRHDLLEALRINRSVYVVVNRYGANKLKYEFGDRAVRLFIYVNKQSIRERFEARGLSHDVLSHYMDHYIEEVTYRKECEHVFENLELGPTTERVKATLAMHLRTMRTPEAG